MGSGKRSGRALINPKVLKWARESSFLTLAQAAHAAGIKRPEKLAASESGEDHISLRQAQRFARSLRLPLSLLYLDDVPLERPLPADLRSHHGADIKSFDVVKAMRTVRRKADAARRISDALDSRSGQLPTLTDASADALGKRIAPFLCVPLWDSKTREGLGDYRSGKALNRTKESVEEQFGVFIFEAPIDTELFRGCALSEDETQIVVISSKDQINARRFTLAHELAHLLMRQSGFCNPADTRNSEIERLCDEASGEALMPKAFLEMDSRALSHLDSEAAVRSLARKYFVSYSSAAVRLAQVNQITWAEAKRLLAIYKAQWKAEVAKQSEAEGGPHAYSTRVRWLGPGFTSTVLRGLDSEIISIARAAELLGIAPSYENIRMVREKFVEAYG